MISRPPPQPLPANSRLYNTQNYSGFVLTIDGHLVYSPFTNVVTGAVPVDDVCAWTIANPGFFYNTTRGTTIDRTGAFVKIYRQSNNEQIATAIILNANFAPNTVLLRIIKYEFNKNQNNLAPLFVPVKLRLEDNWKFCSNVPDWIPADAESRSRWIPILSSELEPSLGQKLNLKGGVTSVDGLSIPLVLDTSYQDDNRIQRLFAEDAATYQYDKVPEGQTGIDNVIESNISTSSTQIAVGDLGDPVQSLPDMAGDYVTYYPFLNPSGLELALPEPWFIDTEAIIATSRTGGIAPPPPAVALIQYGVQRGIDSTPKTPHGKYSVIFAGMPYPIGQTCKLWEVSNFNNVNNQDWILSYRGMIENLALSEGLAACSVEISSITFTARVNAGFATQTTALERRKAPGRSTKSRDFFNTFIATQSSFQDRFCWVRINNIALPIVVSGIVNYELAKQFPAIEEDLWQNYGLFPDEIEARFRRTLESGTTDVGYKIGLSDATGVEYYVSKLYRSNFLQYNGFDPIIVNNYFKINQSVIDGYSDFLPINSPWGFYIIDQLADSDQHTAFMRLREDIDLTSLDPYLYDLSNSRRLAICDYFSDGDASFIHMFQNFSKGYSPSTVPTYSRNFVYTGDDSSVETTDVSNFYLQASVIDVILQILTSTGSGLGSGPSTVVAGTYRQIPGTNGAWDLAPREFGLGIDLDEVDLDSFNRVRRKRGGMNTLLATNIYMEVGKDTPQKFLEEQILKPFFFALGTNSLGKIILVDVSDITRGADAKVIPPEKFVRKNGRQTRVTLSYDATDLSDSFTYDWKEPYRNSWDDPLYLRTLTSSGNAAGAQTRTLFDGEVVTIKSKARLFQRIQASPIKYELKYSPVKAGAARFYQENVGLQALRYLRRFSRVVPRAKFELFYDYGTSPDIGDVVTFNLDAIPNKEGLIGDAGKTIVGKVIDIKVDRKARTAEYTAILTDTSFSPEEVVWNLTAELNGTSGPLTWELTIDDFCIGTNEEINPATGDIIWAFDSSQFLVGSKIIVWDLNWRYITDTTITDVIPILPGIVEIEVADDTGFVTGYRITLETLANSTSQFAGAQMWFNEGQRYLF